MTKIRLTLGYCFVIVIVININLKEWNEHGHALKETTVTVNLKWKKPVVSNIIVQCFLTQSFALTSSL